MKNNVSQSERIQHISIISIIFLGFVFLIWRVRYGYCFNDEPFILTLAQRISQGDKLIFDEWHGCQPFGVVLLPLVKLYLGINGSTEGILLFSRYCFCMLWFATALCAYFTLRRYSRFAISCFVYFILFAPLDYMTCSYTSFGIMAVILLGCLLLKAKEWLSSTKSAVVIGAASSLLVCVTVLSSPYFAVAYFICIFALLVKKGKTGLCLAALLSNIIFTALLGGICFFVFSLQGHTVGELISRLPYIFSDPAHTETLISKIIDTAFAVYRPMLIFYAIGFGLSAVYIYKYSCKEQTKKLRYAVALYCVIVFVFSRIAIAKMVIAEHSFNYEMLDLALLGFAAFILLEKKPWKLFMCFSCTNILYALCTFIASNTKLMSISAALVPCGVVGIIYIIMLAKEIEADLPCELKSIAIVVVVFVMLCQFSLQICVRTSRQYWDYPLKELTQTIECGAAKGLVSEPGKCEEYETEYEALNALLAEAGDTSGKRFVNLTDNPVVYLDANLKLGTFSAWSFGYGDALSQHFEQYYESVPENIPQLIFYTDDREYLTSIFDVEDYTQYDRGEYHLLVKNS